MRSFRKVLISPFEVRHTNSELGSLTILLKKFNQYGYISRR